MKDDLALLWKALSDPTRREILDRLRERPWTTGELAESFPSTRFAVMKHLEVLVEAGLVLPRKQGRERWNHLNAQPLQALYERWVRPYEAHWAGGLQRLKTWPNGRKGRMRWRTTGSAWCRSSWRSGSRRGRNGSGGPWSKRSAAGGRGISTPGRTRGDSSSSRAWEGGCTRTGETAPGRSGTWSPRSIPPRPWPHRTDARRLRGTRDSLLRLVLRPEGEETVLELTDSEFRRPTEKAHASLEEGWRELFEKAFKTYVEQGERV